MEFKNLKRHAWLINLVIVSVSLAAVVIMDRLVIAKLQETRVIYIRLFDSSVTLPNTFFVELGATGEVSFKGVNERIVMGCGDVTSKQDLMPYLRKSLTSENERCGLTVINSATDNIQSTLIFDSRHYAWFIGVKPELMERLIADICQNRSRR